MKIFNICAVFLLFNTFFIYSENIRGPVINIIDAEKLSDAHSAVEFDLSAEELFAISPDFSNLPDKISIEIRSTETIKRFRDSFALYSYTNVTPGPSITNKSYTGNYTESAVIPDRTRFFIDILLNSSLSANTSVKGTKILDYSNVKEKKPFMFTILPVMKGVPDYLFSEKFKIKIKTDWPDKGKLSLKVFTYQSSNTDKKEVNDFSLLIDGKNYNSADKIVLNTGIHSVSVLKKGFIEHKENINVETNEIKSLEVLLKPNNPHITVFSPDESILYIDGKVRNSKKISSLLPGEHTIVFKLGEYSLSRTIELEEGKNYVINMLLDIEVKEE